jgi:uncharacterized protein YkwD
MKRLFLYLLVLVTVFTSALTADIGTADAKAKVKGKAKVSSTATIDMDKLIGAEIGAVTAEYGKQQRIDPSEYGFDWYVFNKDYNRFMMVGVDGGKVVAAYCNSEYLLSQNYVTVGMTRTKVRSKFGDPVTTIRSGNTIYVFPNTDKKDIYLIDGYYVYVYYDVFNSYKVTSVLEIKKDYEDKMIGHTVKLNSALTDAYSAQSVDLVNSIRARNGLSTLSYFGQAASLAEYRSKDMRDRDYFSHYTPEGRSPAYFARKRGMKYRTLCENIACGHRNAISAFEAFMNSRGHRKNILYNIKQIGVGTVSGGDRSVIVTYILLTKK